MLARLAAKSQLIAGEALGQEWCYGGSGFPVRNILPVYPKAVPGCASHGGFGAPISRIPYGKYDGVVRGGTARRRDAATQALLHPSSRAQTRYNAVDRQ
jgi:hypothetical protein